MNDYISKSSVCEILSDLYPMDGERVVSVTEINKAYEKIIQLQYEKPKQQWIPCSERLPKENDYRPCYENSDGVVWCMCKNGRMLMGRYHEPTHKWVDFEEYFIEDTDVIAWMPLPEPYKESEK